MWLTVKISRKLSTGNIRFPQPMAGSVFFFVPLSYRVVRYRSVINNSTITPSQLCTPSAPLVPDASADTGMWFKAEEDQIGDGLLKSDVFVKSERFPDDLGMNQPSSADTGTGYLNLNWQVLLSKGPGRLWTSEKKNSMVAFLHIKWQSVYFFMLTTGQFINPVQVPPPESVGPSRSLHALVMGASGEGPIEKTCAYSDQFSTRLGICDYSPTCPLP